MKRTYNNCYYYLGHWFWIDHHGFHVTDAKPQKKKRKRKKTHPSSSELNEGFNATGSLCQQHRRSQGRLSSRRAVFSVSYVQHSTDVFPNHSELNDVELNPKSSPLCLIHTTGEGRSTPQCRELGLWDQSYTQPCSGCPWACGLTSIGLSSSSVNHHSIGACAVANLYWAYYVLDTVPVLTCVNPFNSHHPVR